MNPSVDINSLPHGTRCISRAVAIIKMVAGLQKNGATLSQISYKLSLPVSTTKRILSVLVLEGFLSKNEDSKRYYLGHDLVHTINKSWRSRFRKQYKKVLNTIACQIPDTVYMQTRTGFDTVCIAFQEGRVPVRINYGVGSRYPLGLATSGTALLGILSLNEIKTIMSINKPNYMKYKISQEEIWGNLLSFKELGFVRHYSKVMPGTAGVSIPFFDSFNEMTFAITVTTTTERLTIPRSLEFVDVIRHNAEKEACFTEMRCNSHLDDWNKKLNKG